MPNSDDEEPRSRSPLKLLFWAGIGLAPIAMLLLLLADGNGPLRIAAVLAVLAVVLIGLSIGLRGDAESVRVELEDMVADEIDGLQGDVRRDIETAARATHRQLGEKLQTLQQTVDAMRAQLDAQRAGPRPPAVAVPAQARDSGSAGGVREGATYGRGEGTTYGAGRAGTAYDGGAGGYPREAGAGGYPREAGAGGYPREADVDERAANPQPAMAAPGQTYGAPVEGQAAAGGAARPPRARAPGGVVRHTETVQVTTRHTVVDGRGGGTYGTGDVYGADNRYRDDSRYRDDTRYGEDGRSADYDDGAQGGGSYGAGQYGGGQGGRRRQDEAAEYDNPGYGRRARVDDEQPVAWGAPGDGEESFTDRRLRELRGDRPAIERGDPPAYDDQWSSARGGDRWAAVREDDRGRELRVGERRASVRADESGTEYRIEDRWAAVRRDDDRAPVRRDDDRVADGPGAWYADAWSGEPRSGGGTYGSSGTAGTYGASTYGRGQDDRGDEWSGGRAADRAAAWGRGAYDDDRGGDDRWR